MSITVEIVEEIYREILERNIVLSIRSIPHSDEFIKSYSARSGVEPDIIKQAVRILIESHRIFSIEIVAEDKKHSIQKIDGFVAADIEKIRTLKNFFGDQLISAYEKQNKKRMGLAQIIKEIFPMMHSLNNTEIGQVANKTIMLNEFERLMDKEWQTFSPDSKEKKMKEIFAQQGIDIDSKKTTVEKEPSKKEVSPAENGKIAEKGDTAGAKHEEGRAVDSTQYRDYVEKGKSYPLSRILSIYGLEFFLRVNFRKYQFKYVKQIIEDRQITRRNDLLLVRDLLAKVKENMYIDKELSAHRDEIYDLERAILKNIFFEKKK